MHGITTTLSNVKVVGNEFYKEGGNKFFFIHVGFATILFGVGMKWKYQVQNIQNILFTEKKKKTLHLSAKYIPIPWSQLVVAEFEPWWVDLLVISGDPSTSMSIKPYEHPRNNFPLNSGSSKLYILFSNMLKNLQQVSLAFGIINHGTWLSWWFGTFGSMNCNDLQVERNRT